MVSSLIICAVFKPGASSLTSGPENMTTAAVDSAAEVEQVCTNIYGYTLFYVPACVGDTANHRGH